MELLKDGNWQEGMYKQNYCKGDRLMIPNFSSDVKLNWLQKIWRLLNGI